MNENNTLEYIRKELNKILNENKLKKKIENFILIYNQIEKLKKYKLEYLLKRKK